MYRVRTRGPRCPLTIADTVMPLCDVYVGPPVLSIYIYIYTHTHTHIYIYIYIYMIRTAGCAKWLDCSGENLRVRVGS